MALGRRIKISLVHYLNAAPLGWAFQNKCFRDEFQIISCSPAMCAEQLAQGVADIGLIPSIEYQRIPNLKIIPEIAIGSGSKVRSVVLVLHRRRSIRSIAVDTSSRTSVALAEILLEERLGFRPALTPHPPDLRRMLQNHDGALIIGDHALKASDEEFEVVDLAESWVNWQQLPFVFAFWACRSDVELPGDLSAIFKEAKILGLAALGEIAEQYSSKLNLPGDFLLDYLTQNIDYDFGVPQILGLGKFYDLSEKKGLIKEVRPLSFLEGSRHDQFEASVRGSQR